MAIQLDDGNSSPFCGPYELVQRFRPNRLWFNETEQAAAIVIARASGGDFAINCDAYDYVSKRLAEGKITAAYVVFVERNTTTVVVGCSPLHDVERGEPIEGKLGSILVADSDLQKRSAD